METNFLERYACLRKHLRSVTLADVFDVRVLGFALVLAWAYIVLFSTTIHFSMRNDVSHFNSVFGFSSVGMLAVLICAAFLPRVFTWFVGKVFLRWTIPVLMSAATTVLVVIDFSFFQQPWCSLASVLIGFGLGCMYLAWGSVYKVLPISQAIVKTASSFILAALLFAIAVALPRPFGVVITVVLPLVVGVILFAVLHVWSEPAAKDTRVLRRGAFSIRALLSVGVLSFTESLMRALFFNATPIISEGSYPWLFLVATLVSLVIVAAPLFTRADLNFPEAYRACVFVLAFVFLLLPILELGSFIADLLALVIYCVVTLLVWIVLVRISSLYGISAVLAFGVGWAAHIAGALAGTFGGALFGTYAELSPKLLSILALVCACLLFFAYLFLFNERFMQRFCGGEVLPQANGTAKKGYSFRQRCDLVATRAKLTEREKDIMILIAKGRSTPRICSLLGITPGTVNTHLSHLYRKLNVHDKQDLIDLLEQVANTPEQIDEQNKVSNTEMV